MCIKNAVEHRYVRDRAWFVRLHGEIIIDRTGAQTMLYLTCTMISSVDLAHYGVSRAKDTVSVNCGTQIILLYKKNTGYINFLLLFTFQLLVSKTIDIAK